MRGQTQGGPAGSVLATAAGWEGPQGPPDRRARVATNYRPLQTFAAQRQLDSLGFAEGYPNCGSTERGVSMVNTLENLAQSRRQGEPDPRRPGGMSHGSGCQRGAAPDSTPPAGLSRCGHLSALPPAPAGAERYRPRGFSSAPGSANQLRWGRPNARWLLSRPGVRKTATAGACMSRIRPPACLGSCSPAAHGASQPPGNFSPAPARARRPQPGRAARLVSSLPPRQAQSGCRRGVLPA